LSTGSRTILLRAFIRGLATSLVLFTFASGAGLWGLWSQQRELDRLAQRLLPQADARMRLAEQARGMELELLRYLGSFEPDLGKTRTALEQVRAGLETVSAEAGGAGNNEDLQPLLANLGTRLRGLQDGGTDRMEAADVLAEVRGARTRVEQWLQTQSKQKKELADQAGASIRTHSRLVALGLVAGWLLMATTILFALRRLQAPFENILAFMRRASEKDLSGELTGAGDNELGALAVAATALSSTLVATIDSLRQVAGEARNRGTNLEVGALQATQGAEDQSQRAAAGEERARAIETELTAVAALSSGLRSGAEQAATSVEQILAMTEEVRAEMEGITERVTNSSRAVEELSQASTRMAALSSQVGVASQSVAAAATAIDQATETLSAGASEGRSLTEDVVHKAKAGRDAMTVSLHGMERIREAVGAAVQSFERLGEELGRVGRVTQVIDDIAGRTNLLSLNAAIIAAQAGEQGKAFGVVATEIRSLAEKTAHSTREIRTLVDGLVEGGREAHEAISAGAERVAEGEQRVRHTGTLLGDIFASADRAARRLVEIEGAAAGQAIAAGHVAEEIRQVSEGMGQIVVEVQHQESRAHAVHQDLLEIEAVARQTARAADEQTRGTELITHTMVEVSEISENLDTSIGRVGDLLTNLRQDLEALGTGAKRELKRIAEIEVEGKGLSSLAGKLQLETSGFRLPPHGAAQQRPSVS